MKNAAVLLSCLTSMSLWGYQVSVDTVVANPGMRVAVPIRVDTIHGIANVGVRITYDPQILILQGAEKGDVALMLDDDFVEVVDEGVISLAAFGESNATNECGGVLATLNFKVREGAQGVFSDVTVANVKFGEESGVRDVTVDNPISVVNGMVRVMSSYSDVSRLEGAQTIVADTVLSTVTINDGDGIQASGNMSAVVVSNAVTCSADVIGVTEPTNGWTCGRYELLKTPTAGLKFDLAGVLQYSLTTEVEDDMVVYVANIGDHQLKVGKALDFAIEAAGGDGGSSFRIPTEWLIANKVAKLGEGVRDVSAKVAAKGKNGAKIWESFVLGLDPQKDTSKPVVIPIQTSKPDRLTLSVGNVTVNQDAGAKSVRYRVLYDKSPIADTEQATDATRTEYTDIGNQIEVPLPSEGVRYYRIEVQVK